MVPPSKNTALEPKHSVMFDFPGRDCRSARRFSGQQTTQAVTFLDQRIIGIEKNAETTDELSCQAAEDAQIGLQAVETSLKGISSLNSIIAKTGVAIKTLGKQSQSIGQVLTVIDANGIRPATTYDRH